MYAFFGLAVIFSLACQCRCCFLCRDCERERRNKILQSLDDANDEAHVAALRDVALVAQDIRALAALRRGGGGGGQVPDAPAANAQLGRDGGGEFIMPAAPAYAEHSGSAGEFHAIRPDMMGVSLDQLDGNEMAQLSRRSQAGGIEMAELSPRSDSEDEAVNDPNDEDALYIDINDVPPSMLEDVNRLLADAYLGQLSYDELTNEGGHGRYDNA